MKYSSILNLKYLNYSMPKRVKNGEIQETGNLYIKILSHQYWTSSFTTILRILVRKGIVCFLCVSCRSVESRLTACLGLPIWAQMRKVFVGLGTVGSVLIKRSSATIWAEAAKLRVNVRSENNHHTFDVVNVEFPGLEASWVAWLAFALFCKIVTLSGAILQEWSKSVSKVARFRVLAASVLEGEFTQPWNTLLTIHVRLMA